MQLKKPKFDSARNIVAGVKIVEAECAKEDGKDYVSAAALGKRDNL